MTGMCVLKIRGQGGNLAKQACERILGDLGRESGINDKARRGVDYTLLARNIATESATAPTPRCTGSMQM